MALRQKEDRHGPARRRVFSRSQCLRDRRVREARRFAGIPSARVAEGHAGDRFAVLTCGAAACCDPKEDLRYIRSFEFLVLGSNGWMRDDLKTFLEMIAAGTLKPIVDRELPFEKVDEAFRLIEDREVFGRIVVKP